MPTDEITKTAYSLRQKGIDCYSVRKFDSAFYFFNQSKIEFEKLKDSVNVSYCLLQMTDILQRYGDYIGSEETATEALQYAIQQHKASIYNYLGIAAKELTNYDDAIKYYKIAMVSTVDSIDRLSPLNNIAAVYIQKKEYHKAINILESILNVNQLDKNQLLAKKARFTDNLGFAYYKANKEIKGLELMNKALATKLQIEDSYSSIESYLHLAEYYYDKKHFEKAFEQASYAYQLATKGNSIDERLEALGYLVRDNNGKREKHNYFIKKYLQLNDSIRLVRNRAKNQFAKIRYDARVANEENLKLKNKNIATDLQLEKSQNEKNIWISASALLACFLFILYNYLKNKNKLEKQKATYFTETKIAKKIHDEIANDVFQTMSFVETKKIEEPEHKETLINLLDTLYQRSRNISKENESIETGESFIENLIEMINGYKSANQNVIIKKDETINWGTIAEIKKITLFRVLQELLVNMKKHSQASIVIVSFASHKNDIAVDYSDNGKGFATHQVKKSGMANVENRIQNINGKITFDTTGHGLKVKMSIPK